MRALLVALTLGMTGAAVLPMHQADAWWYRYRYPYFVGPRVVVVGPPAPYYYGPHYGRWVPPHYNPWGRFIPGHWF